LSRRILRHAVYVIISLVVAVFLLLWLAYILTPTYVGTCQFDPAIDLHQDRSHDIDNWSLTVMAPAPGALLNATYLSIQNESGDTALPPTPLADLLEPSSSGVLYDQADPAQSSVQMADVILVEGSKYGPGTAVQVSTNQSCSVARVVLT
jgi:hypothetical protein